MEENYLEQLNEILGKTSENIEQAKAKEDAVCQLVKKMSTDEIRTALKGCKTHCLVNQKGGVSKTTSSSNLAYVLAQKGFKVLAIDTDSQSNLTGLCNVLPNEYTPEGEERVKGLQDIYGGYIDKDRDISFDEDIKPCIVRPTYTELVRTPRDDGKFDIVEEKKEFGFDLIPSDIELGNYDILLARNSKGGFALYDIVRTITEAVPYDFVIIDCPPALTMLAYNGIGASVDGCIVPLNLEVMTLRGTKNVNDASAEIQELFKKANQIHKGILGMIKSQYVKRSRIQRDFEDVVNDFFPVRAFKASIPNLTACDKAHARGVLFAMFEPKAYDAYAELVNEIIADDIIRNDEKETEIVSNIDREVGEKLYSN